MQELRGGESRRIGRYEVLRPLGAGGMGEVFLARSPGGRQVAVKIVHPDLQDDPEALPRFRREVAVVRGMRSAFSAALVDAETEHAPYWLATEYLAGPTLAAAVAAYGRPLPAATCRRLLAALAEAVADAHRQGVLHRDLKPSNVILAADGPRLIDFGIARSPAHTATGDPQRIAGTLGYLAPEVLSGRERGGPPADVFALAGTAAFAATRRPPFAGNGAPALIYQAVAGGLDLDGVEPEFAALLRRCAAREPADRPTAADIVRDLNVDGSLVDDPVYRELTGGAGTTAPDGAPAGVPGTVHVRPPGRLTSAVGGTSAVLGAALALVLSLAAGRLPPAAPGAAATSAATSAATTSPKPAQSATGSTTPLTGADGRPGPVAPERIPVADRDLAYSSASDRCNHPATGDGTPIDGPYTGDWTFPRGPDENRKRLFGSLRQSEDGRPEYTVVEIRTPAQSAAHEHPAAQLSKVLKVGRPDGGMPPESFAAYPEDFPGAAALDRKGDWTVVYYKVRPDGSLVSSTCGGFRIG
ncbi:serine/threonine-protein kinase [Kitasatospora sp. DSM 101779]|uniref:serine/threonine-protein kinase n=1 Tax=Kitasatospora sp. DSM 101779 TaxID=2853165 RepID=UPI0021D84BA4|nr:serine/threonine-protein kinase [Kitasatospora sp. DSM 101779]MCU7821554.1 serine/threonine protein kinase [Kitasatospora sp. DSM 101779]